MSVDANISVERFILDFVLMISEIILCCCVGITENYLTLWVTLKKKTHLCTVLTNKVCRY
jgi:hypothetical protein